MSHSVSLGNKERDSWETENQTINDVLGVRLTEVKSFKSKFLFSHKHLFVQLL